MRGTLYSATARLQSQFPAGVAVTEAQSNAQRNAYSTARDLGCLPQAVTTVVFKQLSELQPFDNNLLPSMVLPSSIWCIV
jgi:hypothetical protein